MAAEWKQKCAENEAEMSEQAAEILELGQQLELERKRTAGLKEDVKEEYERNRLITDQHQGYKHRIAELEEELQGVLEERSILLEEVDQIQEVNKLITCCGLLVTVIGYLTIVGAKTSPSAAG